MFLRVRCILTDKTQGFWMGLQWGYTAATGNPEMQASRLLLAGLLAGLAGLAGGSFLTVKTQVFWQQFL